MNQTEATSRARAFVLANTGVDADPDDIELTTGVNNMPTWRAFYSVAHFHAEELAAGATIDGGEYIVDVNDATGQVSVFA